MRRARRLLSVGMVTATALAACVDLFHSTDFPALCAHDASACVEASTTDAGTPEAPSLPDRPIDLCVDSPATARANAEHACAWLGACLGTGADESFSACMLRALAAYDCAFNPSLRPRGTTATLWACLATVTSCSDTSQCIFGTRSPPECVVNGGASSLTTCSGTNVVECQAGATKAIRVTPCAIHGQTCARVDDGLSLCAGAGGAGSLTLDAGCVGRPSCQGTDAIVCRSAAAINTDVGIRCSEYGDGRCASDEEGVACVPVSSARSCNGTSKVTCTDAGAAESCVDGRQVRIDCASIGHRCNADGVPTTDPSAACVNVTGTSGCSFNEDTCVGPGLASCTDGRYFDVDCRDVGLGGCSQRKGRNATCVLERP